MRTSNIHVHICIFGRRQRRRLRIRQQCLCMWTHLCVIGCRAANKQFKKTNDRVSVRRRKTKQIININKSHLQICALDESERNGAILWQLTLNLYKNKNRSLVCFVCAWTKSASKKIWNYSTEIVLLCLFGQLNGINRLTLTFNQSMNRNNCWYQSIL